MTATPWTDNAIEQQRNHEKRRALRDAAVILDEDI